MKKLSLMLAVLFATFSFAACGEYESAPPNQKDQVEKQAKKNRAYLPKNGIELRNYNDAQKLYDSPSSIIWCTSFPANPNAPIITTPIAGKLTSSSTTFFSPDEVVKAEVEGDGYGPQPLGIGSSRSVDGLFHPNPPQYRYGFTPGGQYVDFFELPTYCTTALTKFQRQSTNVTVRVDPEAQRLTAEAEKAYASGDKAKAQDALDALETAR